MTPRFASATPSPPASRGPPKSRPQRVQPERNSTRLQPARRRRVKEALLSKGFMRGHYGPERDALRPGQPDAGTPHQTGDAGAGLSFEASGAEQGNRVNRVIVAQVSPTPASCSEFGPSHPQ